MYLQNKQKLAAMLYLIKIYPHLYKIEREFDKETGNIVINFFEYTNRLNSSLDSWQKKESIFLEKSAVIFKWRTENENSIPQQPSGYYEVVSEVISKDGLVQKTWHYRPKLVYGAYAIHRKDKIADENIRYFNRKGDPNESL